MIKKNYSPINNCIYLHIPLIYIKYIGHDIKGDILKYLLHLKDKWKVQSLGWLDFMATLGLFYSEDVFVLFLFKSLYVYRNINKFVT